MPEKIILVDGHSIINRAFYGVPPLTNSRGIPTNGVYGFMNILYKYLDEHKPQYLLVAFDRHEPTFRHEMYAEYKGTRKPMPDDLHRQIPILKELIRLSGILTVELPGYEADDILGTASRMAAERGLDAIIVSGDRDMTQLVNENVTLFIPKTKGGYTETEVYTPSEVMSKFGVTPHELIEVKALQGDSSDNIPGVPGIGEKTALSLIAKYHDLDSLKNDLDNITPPKAKKALTEHFDMAVMSRKLAEICLTAPLELDLDAARVGNIYTHEAYAYMGELELKKLMSRFGDMTVLSPAAHVPKAELITVDEFTDPGHTDAILKDISSAPVLFLSVSDQDERPGLIICTDESRIYLIKNCFMTDGGCLSAALACVNRRKAEDKATVTADLQSLLRAFELDQKLKIFDLTIAAYLIDPNRGSYQYDDISRDYLGEILPPKKDLSQTPDELYKAECAVLYRAYPVLKRLLAEKELQKLHDELEIPLSFSLHRMETAGIRVDINILDEIAKKLNTSFSVIKNEIYELAGMSFNINSPKQLGEVLFENIGLPAGKKTKTGWSTSADVLEKLKTAHPIIPKILTYRQLTKLYSTYAVGLRTCISEDGRIHGHFNQTIAATGRISSTDPNLQNIPVRMELGKEIRRAFIPADGCIFIDADYSQIELRVLAHMSGDKKLINAYNSDSEIHRITASEVFHVAPEDVTGEMRRNAKAVNFGIVYGISAFGLSEGLSISRKEANDYIERYFDTYPRVKEFLDEQVKKAKDQGFVRTAFGRIRPIPEMKSGNFNLRSFGERVAMNSPIQGTSADIIKLAMINVEKALISEGLRSRIILQIHDELLLEVPDEEADRVRELLKNEMEQAVTFSVPLIAEVNSGMSWFETK